MYTEINEKLQKWGFVGPQVTKFAVNNFDLERRI